MTGSTAADGTPQSKSWRCTPKTLSNGSKIQDCGWVITPPGAYIGQCTQFESSGQCPPGSNKGADGFCRCDLNHVEANGTCRPKKPGPCGPFEDMPMGLPQLEISVGVSSNSALGRMLGNTGTSCFPGGCSVRGTVSGCINAGSGGAVCFLSNPTFTGDSCDDSKNPGNGCPSGSSPSQYAAGVCVPDDDGSKCPSGYAPSQYVTGVCVPENSPDAKHPNSNGPPNKCPAGQVPSRYVADLCIPADNSTDRDGNTTCRGNTCTTTKPDGTQEEKPRDAFCKENPDSPLCIKGTFSGTCRAGFTCKGDAVQCAIAQHMHETTCRLFGDDNDSNSIVNRALRGDDDKSADALMRTAQQVSITQFDQSGFGWSHSCPADPEIPLGFTRSGSLVIPFSRVCGPLNVLSLAALSITLLACLVWVLGPKRS